jgi:hypothetical protein
LATTAYIDRATRRAAILVLTGEQFSPIFDRLKEELEKARQASTREGARAFLKSQDRLVCDDFSADRTSSSI